MNLFRDIPEPLTEEMVTILAESENVKVERIVSEGHTSPEDFWYDQEQNEWVLLLSGSAVLSIEKGDRIVQMELKAGDYLLLPSRQRHRVESTSATEKTIWLAIHFLPPASLEDAEVHRE